MKKTAAIFILTLSAFVAGYGQTPKPTEQAQSNLEKFSTKSGVLIEKSFTDVGTIGRIKAQILTVTDLNTKTQISGLRFEVDAVSRYSTDTKVAFLDQDEIDGLFKSLTLLKNSVLTSTPPGYTEVVFTSRSGFTAGAFYSGKWQLFSRLEKYDSKSFVSLEPGDLDTFLTVIQAAKEKMVK